MAIQRLALIGSNGMLAGKVRELAPAHYEVVGFDLPEFDLTDRAQVLAAMTRLQPVVIVNCAAFTNVDACETQEELATRVNGAGPGYLAEAALAVGAVLVHISTDYVFAGDKGTPYAESDPTGPLSAYGRSKLAGEQAIVASGLQRYFILRTSWLYGPGGKNFVETMLRLAAERDELRVVADQVGAPTYTGDLAAAIFNLLKIVTRDDEAVTRDDEAVTRDDEAVTRDDEAVTGSDSEPFVTRHPSRVTDFRSEAVTRDALQVTGSDSEQFVTRHPSPVTDFGSEAVTRDALLVTGSDSEPFVTRHPSPVTALFGLYHFSNSGETSWHDFAVEIIRQARQQGELLRVEQVVPIATSAYPLPAPRPAYSVFSHEKYRAATAAPIPAWQESLATYLRERKKASSAESVVRGL